MNSRAFMLGCVAIGLMVVTFARADVDSGEFSYQGQLKQGGVPVTDTCDFEFSLWKDPVATDQVGATLVFDGGAGNAPPIDVANGLFSALLDFGPTAFTDAPRWLEVAVRCPSGSGVYTTLSPREKVTAVPLAVRTRGIAVDADGQVGVGTDNPRSQFHVRGNGLDDLYGNHVAFFENTSGREADGIAIQIHNESTNRDNNFITFLNGARRVTGRIEGFDLENGDWIAPPPLPDVGMTFDPAISYNPNWLNPGSLPTVNWNAGSLPTANFNPGTLPIANFSSGTLPSLTFNGGSLPTANLNRGTLPSLTFDDGSLPSFSGNYCNVVGVNVLCGFNWSAGSTPTASLNAGTLPSLTFTQGTLPTANFTQGTLPGLNFSGGTLPSLTFNRGALPSLTFSGGALPSILAPPITFGEPSLTFDLPTAEELEALFCWSVENGVNDMIGLDPVSIAAASLKEAALTACKDEGVTYGSKGADYAEWLPKLNPSDRFQFAQIVGVHGGKVSLKTKGAEQIMAVSRAPVVVGNVPPVEEEAKYVTVGFMGQLPVVVRGKVRAGDYIIPSGMEDGTAVAVSPEKLTLRHLGRVLGRAWSDSDNDVYGLVTVAIGLNNNEFKIILEEQQQRIDEQDSKQLALAAENARLKADMEAVNGKLAAVLASVEQLEDAVHAQGACREPLAFAEMNR